MPTAKKRKLTSPAFSETAIAKAKAAAPVNSTGSSSLDWAAATVTPGGGVAATIAALRGKRGPGRKPPKEQVAIRLDPDVLAAFRAGGPGWQTRMNAALKEWLETRALKRKSRGTRAA